MKRILQTVLILLALTAMTATTSQANTDWPDQLTFGVIPVASSRNMSDSFGNLNDHLKKELGIDVKLQMAGDYAGVITGMQHNHIDIAYLGPKSYCEAAKRANAEALVVEVGQSGVAGYHGYILTKAGSGLKSIEDLKDKKWAFTDPHSTSGTLVPTIHFNNINIDPEKYFNRVIYSGSHEASILSVKSGKVDGASTNDLDFDRGLGTHWTKEDFNIIWKSDLIPGSPMAVRRDLPASLKKAIQ
ncbi:MAG TPA: phosphonate ABC transporter substrate-binding protein, partial [Desulfobacterales bacterium]|nr:phosphonate ABC transporter substrate-binding protein [Desulfobacterales bacterium]